MFAAFWPFDWSFDGFLVIMICLFSWTAWSVKETAKSAVKAAQKMAENETVQEAGWSVFHSWLGSVFKKH